VDLAWYLTSLDIVIHLFNYTNGGAAWLVHKESGETNKHEKDCVGLVRDLPFLGVCFVNIISIVLKNVLKSDRQNGESRGFVFFAENVPRFPTKCAVLNVLLVMQRQSTKPDAAS
jgi:hypothetical protein